MDQSAEFRAIVFYEKAACLRVFNDESVETAHWNVMDAHICVVTTAKFNLLCIIEIDDVQMFLALVVLLLLLLSVQLETFDNDVIPLRFLNVKYLMVPLSHL